MVSYNNYCNKLGLDAFCEDVFESTDKQIEYFYRTIQFVMFDVVEENHFAKSGIYNYDVCLYKDGTAEMIYRHGVEDGKVYVIDNTMRFELGENELTVLNGIFSECDFENLPTWNPQEPQGSDGETTYVFGTNRLFGHLAARWCAPPEDGVYKIRNIMEQLLRAHES